jgi:hypothetical protein
MAVRITRVDFSGPFFQRDPARTIRDNIRDLMAALAEEGERDVRGQIEQRAGSMPNWTGWTRDHVKGRTASLSGKRWAVTAVVSADSSGMSGATAIRTKAAAASIERRWGPFRKTSTTMRRARAAINANLTKGIE